MEIITKSAQETFKLGEKIGNRLILSSDRGDHVLCLSGQLGSGKTTFIQGIAKSLGIIKPVPSPTFIIVRQYETRAKLYSQFYHIDLYRLETKKDLQTLELKEIFSDPNSLIAVEWAEKLASLLPEKRIDISFEVSGLNTRKIKIVNLNNKGNPKTIDEAVAILNQGGIIIFPTDTAFGVGCRIDNEKAVKRLFQIKKRPQIRAVPVLVSSIKMAENYLAPLTDIVRQLMRQYWPGALTVVYGCKTDVTPLSIRGGSKTLGVRMPNHSVPLKLLENTKVPILGPSANFHGQSTPYRYEDIDQNLKKLVDFVIPGECPVENVSTVLDCTTKPFTIIRQGAQKIDQNFLK